MATDEEVLQVFARQQAAAYARPQRRTVSDAEARATVTIAVAKALIEAATEFGDDENNLIGGNVWTLADAAVEAIDSHRKATR